MSRDAGLWIAEALDAAEEAIALVAGMGLDAFLGDRRTYLSVERLLLVAGEALAAIANKGIPRGATS